MVNKFYVLVYKEDGEDQAPLGYFSTLEKATERAATTVIGQIDQVVGAVCEVVDDRLWILPLFTPLYTRSSAFTTLDDDELQFEVSPDSYLYILCKEME